MNLEDNSELVKTGKALHQMQMRGKNTELSIDNIKIDKLTSQYLIEVKKSDADEEAVKWQVLYYLSVLKKKGIERVGKVEYIEKNKECKVKYYTLTDETESELRTIEQEIENLILSDKMPDVINKNHCKKCSYFEYCYI